LFLFTGTNNSRIAEFLRQLATYYSKSANALFLVRIAQGLLYMGKGLMSLSPLHSDGFLIRPATLASLIVVVYSALFMKNTLLGYLLKKVYITIS
jgi:26S proteasome regulatory subunit N1